jgi:hypothetical protein
MTKMVRSKDLLNLLEPKNLHLIFRQMGAGLRKLALRGGGVAQ